MLYNLQNKNEIENAKNKFEYFLEKGKTIDLIEKKNSRTTKQNSALHLFFTIISNQLNEMGLEFQYTGLKGYSLSLRHSPFIVKNFIWRPIQISLFDIKSTTKINTKQINEITDVIQKFFAERSVLIEFPNIEYLINKN